MKIDLHYFQSVILHINKEIASVCNQFAVQYICFKPPEYHRGILLITDLLELVNSLASVNLNRTMDKFKIKLFIDLM